MNLEVFENKLKTIADLVVKEKGSSEGKKKNKMPIRS